ncbi:phosphoglycolate phosphatase [Oceanobacillus iheyensis HTE831]|uniref:Phosphoglycolate phosphatase n=1 Tax=Oceanobacillus iheyensis (strain DSM 14371 / CIP 107618 / JCM 11309 / KCTC 3954 / HTE831) TaxID=221109 RepID=Q8EQI6_OCEIH|nr:HAD family hydrolase [Oceanobacillus iheyensis]BAC13669.1 phosphoglycolate phosphatase [Oceanobacillus iheyensis HTE831]
MVKTILFDFDGTIANTLPLCFEAFRTVFKEFDQVILTNDEIKEMFGPSETEIIQLNVKHPDKLQAIERFYEVYETLHPSYVKPMEDLHNLLDELDGNGINLGIVTGKAKRSLDISLQQLNIRSNFAVVITGDDVTNPKPHGEGVILAMQELSVTPEEVLFVGDSEADILAGKEANVTTVGVHWSEEVQSADFNTKPDYYLTSIEQFYVELLP